MPGSSVGSETDKIPKSSFEIYRTEGDSLFRSSEYTKATQCYTQALELRPGDRHCLVTRSKCHLYKGDITKALEDAEESLQEDKNFHKGLYQKAEVLYFHGDFETALVFFHRGYKLRPEMEDFRRGIQKCEEAINNAVGDPSVVTLKADGDLSYFYKVEEDEKSRKKQTRGGYNKPKQDQNQAKKAIRKKAEADDKTVRTLLGELYADREYLEKLLKEEEHHGRKSDNSDKIKELAIHGLNYLDARSEFWQQQQPMYSRKRDRQLRSALSGASPLAGDPSAAVKYVIDNLDTIDDKQTRGEHDAVLKHATRVLKQVNMWSETDLPNKTEVVANLYSIMGNAHLELSKYPKALECHEKDLEMGKKHGIAESVSRARDNIGRVYAKMGEYRKAIEIWEEKLPTSKSALESTWLHHEIGRCHLELGDYQRAREYGEKSLSNAREAADDSWQLNASVLVAETETRLGEYQSAIDTFERAMDYAKVLANKQAEDAIKRAMENVNAKIIAKSKEEEKALEKQGSDRPPSVSQSIASQKSLKTSSPAPATPAAPSPPPASTTAPIRSTSPKAAAATALKASPTAPKREPSIPNKAKVKNKAAKKVKTVKPKKENEKDEEDEEEPQEEEKESEEAEPEGEAEPEEPEAVAAAPEEDSAPPPAESEEAASPENNDDAGISVEEPANEPEPEESPALEE